MSPERAMELILWMKWENGMCGCLGAKEPTCPKETEEESAWLLSELRKKSYNYCMAYLLYEIANSRYMIMEGTNGKRN